MKVGMIGLGKLGLPVSTAMAYMGHDVYCYDIDPQKMSKDNFNAVETGPKRTGNFKDWLKTAKLNFCTLQRVVDESELIFVAVQTPHEAEFEGTTRIPDTRKDFNYCYLQDALIRINNCCFGYNSGKTVVVISTVLPGTTQKITADLHNINVLYSPLFIAMGTVMYDFLNPEFTLIGRDEGDGNAARLAYFYHSIHDKPIMMMSIPSAELTKVSYNTFIGMKIAFANTVMEMCQRLGNADCDEVTEALGKATDRIVSNKYLNGGMGDGGGCHPRDNIAMSWLAKELKLSHNIFEDIMLAREDQTEYLADLIINTSRKYNLPIVILGKSFKPETAITTGSPAILLANLLKERVMDFKHYDPYCGDIVKLSKPALFFIATKHKDFAWYHYPAKSVILDPHRFVLPHPHYEVIQIGKPNARNSNVHNSF